MALSPLDIKNKSFPTKMRGYNQEEVDDFLDQIINDYEDVLREKRELEKGLKHAEEKLTYFNELKDALNQSIIVAQDTADKLKDSATRESDVMVTTANADAKSIISQAKAEAESTLTAANIRAKEVMDSATTRASQLAHETDDLKKKTREFHRSLALLLESQLEIVKSKDWDELLKPFSTYVDETQHSAVRDLLDSEHLDKQKAANVELEGSTQAIDLDEISKAADELLAADLSTTIAGIDKPERRERRRD
ncbi:DivIVA domain-containing protein [uncultured Vagococcus sp.]|uniref:DivIVA domain-containing protein n=1 Tax=uncultured Vagococcus sp. TaxID=189676 RepID=UPI0028D5FAC6|nr:DivIVA domain-containing protein [uncultured Vagococcus sp.]